jgi:hypothetical protein
MESCFPETPSPIIRLFYISSISRIVFQIFRITPFYDRHQSRQTSTSENVIVVFHIDLRNSSQKIGIYFFFQECLGPTLHLGRSVF